MKILGIQNWASHEPAAAVLSDDGEAPDLVYAMATEEWMLRSKNSYQFPLHALVDCMDRLGVECLREIDYLATDYSKIPRWINSGPHYRKLLHDYIKLKLDLPDDRIVILRHHDAHAATAYYPSPYNEAAILVIDGVGSENETVSLYRGTGTRIEFCERSTHRGPGALYDIVTALLGFVGNHRCAQPGKTMGLAPYGAGEPGPVLNLAPRYAGLGIDYSAFMSRLPSYRLVQDLEPCPSTADVGAPRTARIAYEVQAEIERALVYLARYALDTTGSRNLVIAGGTGLNCVANGKIVEEVAPEGFYAYPGCSDEGIAVGAALYAYYNILPVPRPKSFVMPNAYTGRTFEQDRIRGVLEELGLPITPCSPADVAERLASGKIVGWFTGGSETGPRALGHRSILADPRDPCTKDLINDRVKHREWFRPFAPSVLEEYACDFFDLDRPSPYMLLARPVREDKKSLIPSVVHVDGTSRIQTVTRQDGKAFYEVIDAFRQRTGIPMVLNTSFNDNNEPIVETPEDALITFMSTEIDVLYLEGFLIEKDSVLEPDTARMLARLSADRSDRQEARFRDFVRRCCRGWNAAELSSYCAHEMIRALWHRRHEAIEVLERFVENERANGRRVGFVGTRDHTSLLVDIIPGLRDLNIVHVHYLSRHDWEDVEFSLFHSQEDSSVPPETVLVTSYEWQDQAAKVAADRFGRGVEVVRPYLSWSDDPRFVSWRSGHEETVLPDDPGERVFFAETSAVCSEDDVS